MKTTYSEGFTPFQRPKVKTMSFEKAVNELLSGKKIHKLEWKDKSYYGMIVEKTLKLHKPDGKFYEWIISYGDLTGDDYIIVS